MKNKGMYRLLSGVLCTSVLLSSQAYAAASADYSDFPQNWSKEAMEFAVKNNFITGVSEDKIAPKAALTRAQLAAILSRVMQTGAGDVSVLDNFTDADKNAWYAGSMAKAVELNIFYGDGDSIYPDRPVTRQELFTILVRAFSVTGGDESTLASYNDAGSISSWAKAAISAMIAQGYAAGYEDKTLRPAQQVTREEFAQLLHRMREHYSSSDTSEDKTETKTDDTAKTDKTTKTNTKKPSGGGGGGSSSGGGSHGGGTVTANKIVDETQAKVQTTDMGAWLPLVFANGYDMSKATVTVDGKDVTKALSKVTTDGTIAKLPLTGTPKQVVVAADGKTQTITLNGTDGAAAVYTGKQYLPQRVLTHGAVAVWDYHLTNYDTDGNIRKEPKTTTFDLNKSANARAFYSPDAELKEGEGFGKVSGEVIIKFNYNTAEEKAWFDGINTLQLAGYSERLESLNNNLEFNTKVATNKYGDYGQLTIELGQPNFFSNGRYYVRVKSTAGETVLVPIHVVNEKAPSMELTELPESGKNLHFNVKDMTYGITSPIESVTLTAPNGKTEKLTYIEDYYLFGDTFVLYNDKENHISYKGNYKLTISSNGFQTFETKFNVREGEEAEKTVVYQYAANDVDVVTHATGGSSSGGSSEDGGGSNTMPANLVFDTDLLANALLLHKMERTTADVEKIVNYWRYDIAGRDSVFDKGATDYYKYSSYITAVNTAQTGNASWLSYADYLNKVSESEDAKNPNRPYAVKAILEDGLLGETQYNGDYGKLTAPDFMVGDAVEGQPVVLTTENKAYVGEIKGLYLNGDWRMLREDAYEIDKTAGTITIKAGVLKVGENTISIVATGYQKKAIAINNNKMKETDLTLSVDKASFKQGETATLTVEGSKGDFLKNLTGVALMKEGKVVKNVLYKGAEGSAAAYYEIDKNAADGNVLKLTLTAQEVEAGDYTVSLTANYYEEPLTAEFKVTAKDAETVTTPAFDSYMLNEADGYYRVSFKGAADDELKAYLNSVETVTVGSKEYTKQNFSSGNLEEDKFRVVASNPAYGFSEYDKLDLAAVGVDTSNDVMVVIKAVGYEDVTFTIAKTSGGGTTNPSEPETPASVAVDNCVFKAKDTSAFGENTDYYRLTFKNLKETELHAYINAITSVEVDGTAYSEKGYLGFKESQFRRTVINSAYSSMYDALDLAANGVDTSKDVKVVIKATGYADLTYTIEKTGGSTGGDSGGSDGGGDSGEAEGKEAPTPASVAYTVGTFSNSYDMIFANDAGEIDPFFEAIEEITVNGETYTKASSSFTFGDTNYILRTADKKIELGTKHFSASSETKIVIKAKGYKPLEFTYKAQ